MCFQCFVKAYSSLMNEEDIILRCYGYITKLTFLKCNQQYEEKKSISDAQVFFLMNRVCLYTREQNKFLLELNEACNRRTINLQFEFYYVRQYADKIMI